MKGAKNDDRRRQWGGFRAATVVLLTMLALFSCKKATPEELAGLAAKGYYEHLLAGEYEQFVEGREDAGRMDEDYREQLVTACKQFAAELQSRRQGVSEVRVATAKTDTALNCTNVFLTLCFGDSTNEEIVVPMCEREGRWRMK